MDATAFNQDISQWNVSSVTDTSNMFRGATSFNQDISQWNVSDVTKMKYMFYDATTFDQNIGQWDIFSVKDMDYMFVRTTLSTANYDAILQGWSSQRLQSHVDFHGGNSRYSSASESARNILVNTYYWRITDGGIEAP